MNLILNNDKINLNNIKIKYINNNKIKIFYIINDINLNGIILSLKNLNYYIKNNKYFIKLNNNHILHKINNHLKDNIKNYKSYINKDNIITLFKSKEIINDEIYLSLKLLKRYDGYFYLNIYQI